MAHTPQKLALQELAAQELAAAVRESTRHVLRQLEAKDWKAARAEIDALLTTGALSPSFRSLLEGFSSWVDQDNAAAAARLAATLDLDPQSSYAHYGLAEMHAREGRVAAAVASVRQALQIEPEMAEGWFLYGRLALWEKEINVAMHSLIQSIQCDIDNEIYWHWLNQWLPRVQLQGPMPAAGRAILIEALRRQKIELSVVDQVTYAILKDTAPVQQLLALADAGRLDAQIRAGSAIALLDDEFFLLVLQRTTLHHVGYEKVLTGLRRALLDTISTDAVPPLLQDVAIRFTSALAIYALTTEFVFYATPAEAGSLSACLQRLRDLPVDDPQLPLLIAIVACYEPLEKNREAVLFKALASPAQRLPEFRAMTDLHLLEPLRIEVHEAAVESLAAISNPVSLAVQRQYEENPYPRWRFLGEAQAGSFDHRISRLLPHLKDDQRPRLQAFPRNPLEVLIAGCGTGRHALWFSREYPAARILAVDLSRASLGYARFKAEEFGITTVDFRQGDILQLPELGRQFDVIESAGVLHHMEDPGLGLAALVRCLRPGGWIRLALYSHSARQAVRIARQRIAEQGFVPTAEGIRRFRQVILADDTDPLHAPCTKFHDFFSLSECRDMLFHVQEHQFTTQALEDLIAAAGLEFMGFEVDVEFVGNAEPRITDWQCLRQWGEFESAHPDFFGSMYKLWLRKPGGAR